MTPLKILFLPDYPDREPYSLASILRILNYTATQSPEEGFDLAMLWQDDTRISPPAVLEEVARRRPVLNLGCTDISKRRVEEVFREVFCYGSFIDPTTHSGRCIEKPDRNAAGWGSVVECPVASRKDGSVYQKLIENVRDGAQIEYRTPVILGEIPQVKVWRRALLEGPINPRRYFSVTPVETSEIYSDEERQGILELARILGLDFGELDILRSGEDGRLYVLDVNKTPYDYGMVNRIPWRPEDRWRSLTALAHCFDRRVRSLLGLDPQPGGVVDPLQQR